MVVWRIAPYQQAKPGGADQLKLEQPRTETEWRGRMDSNLGEVQVLRIEQVIAIVRDGVEPVVAECGRIEDAPGLRCSAHRIRPAPAYWSGMVAATMT